MKTVHRRIASIKLVQFYWESCPHTNSRTVVRPSICHGHQPVIRGIPHISREDQAADQAPPLLQDLSWAPWALTLGDQFAIRPAFVEP